MSRSPQVLTPQGAIGLLRLVTFDKGADYVYERFAKLLPCVNFTHDGPSCIVGHVLDRLGLTAEDARTYGIDGEIAVRHAFTILEDSGFGWSFPPDTVEIFETAQCFQDSGASWGSALKSAEAVYAEYLKTQENSVEVSDDLC